jgi:hypothetical protein
LNHPIDPSLSTGDGGALSDAGTPLAFSDRVLGAGLNFSANRAQYATMLRGGVSMQRQCGSWGVARRSRWLAPLAALVLAGLWPEQALAAPETGHVPVDPNQAQGTPEPSGPEPSYSGSLTLAYTLAPLLAIPTGAGLFELTRSDTFAVIGAGLAVVAVPMTIHLLNEHPGRAATSALLLPVVTVGALGVGTLLGWVIGSAACGDDSECELSDGVRGAIIGGLLGGLAGYVAYAIYDVSAHSSLDPPQLGRVQLQLWAVPVLEGRREDATERAAARVGGAIAGATLTF